MMATSSEETPRPHWNDFRVATFAGQLDTHIRTGEDYDTLTLGAIFAMQPAANDKRSSPAFIPSSYCDYDAREHARQREAGSFVCLTGDVDKGDHSLEKIAGITHRFVGESAWKVYSSAHARDGDMRWRIIIPLAAIVGFGDWHDAQTAFFDYMEAAGVEMDRALARAGQPVYLPNVPRVHEKSGTVLRSDDGEPIYYRSATSGAGVPGLDLDRGIIAGGISALRHRRVEDDRERDRIKREAEKRRANRPTGDNENIIADFNASNGLATMLELCGYEQCPRNAEDWRSPNQTGDTFATRIIGDKWVSLSASDAACGVGEKCSSGCYGDAYDLFVHYKHRGDHKAAFRELHAERRAANPNVIYGAFTPPPREDGDPGWTDIPEWMDDDAQSAGIYVSDVEAPIAHVFDCEPVDLWSRYRPPSLPIGVLPPVIERFAVVQSETMGTDPAGLAMAALAACSAAIPDRIKLKVKRHDPTWHESARLWIALIGIPSTKKSPIMLAALRPLNKIDNELFQEYLIRKEAYDSLDAKERKVTPAPKQRRLRIMDATVEAAQEVLKDSPDGVLSQQDELSGWFGAMDKYAAGKGAMADRGFWLQAFNGGPYAVNRVSRGAALIPNLSVTVLGGIQPEPLRRIVSESVDDGLVQRLIPVILGPAVLGKDEPQDESVDRYDEIVRKLWLLKPPQALTGDAVLKFSDEAQAIRQEMEVRHLEMVGAEVISPKMASHFGKYDGIFARLCVLWHCLKHVEDGSLPQYIQADTARSVEDFLHGFIMPSAIAFYTGILGLSDDHDTLIELAAFILSRRLETVQHRDCQRATSNLKALTAENTRRLFEKLESLGWIEQTDPARNSRTPRWLVNPAVHELFADRGRQERERRDRARAALKYVFSGEEA